MFNLNTFKEGEMYIVGSYLVYLTISIAVTVWVGRTLYRNGRVFLIDAFHGNTSLAESVNHLLVVGFFLLNTGYVALEMETAATADNARQAIELVTSKIGWALLVLGVVHFFNLYVLNRLRRRGESEGSRYGVRHKGGWAPEAGPLGPVLD